MVDQFSQRYWWKPTDQKNPYGILETRGFPVTAGVFRHTHREVIKVRPTTTGSNDVLQSNSTLHTTALVLDISRAGEVIPFSGLWVVGRHPQLSTSGVSGTGYFTEDFDIIHQQDDVAEGCFNLKAVLRRCVRFLTASLLFADRVTHRSFAGFNFFA